MTQNNSEILIYSYVGKNALRVVFSAMVWLASKLWSNVGLLKICRTIEIPFYQPIFCLKKINWNFSKHKFIQAEPVFIHSTFLRVFVKPSGGIKVWKGFLLKAGHENLKEDFYPHSEFSFSSLFCVMLQVRRGLIIVK